MGCQPSNSNFNQFYNTEKIISIETGTELGQIETYKWELDLN